MHKPALLLITLFATCALHAQSSTPDIISISPQQCVWRAGDNPAWAAPNLDDTDWHPYATWRLNPDHPRYWVRCHFDARLLTDLTNPAVEVRQNAAYQLFINGPRVASAGSIRSGQSDWNEDQIFLLPKPLPDLQPALLALRLTYRLFYAPPFFPLGPLQLRIGSASALNNRRAARILAATTGDMTTFMIFGVVFVVGVLMVGIFLFDRSRVDIMLLGLASISTALLRIAVFPIYLLYPVPNVLAVLALTLGFCGFIPYVWFFYRLAGRRVPFLYRFLLAVFCILPSAWLLCCLLPLRAALLLGSFLGGATRNLTPLALFLHVAPFFAFWPWSGVKSSLRPIAGLSLFWGFINTAWLAASILYSDHHVLRGVFWDAVIGQLLDWRALGSAIVILALLTLLFRDQRRISSERAALAGEMEAAREVQRHLVPAILPQSDRIRLEAAYIPAAEVGGDFYQVFPKSRNGSVLIVVGDVSGKGLKAAMTGTLVLGALRNMAQESVSPSQILSRLNSQLADTSDGGFVTCLCARIAADGTLTLANAGHLAPYRNGEEVHLESGLPLGVTADTVYAESTIQLTPGDTLTFLSDGVVEAQSATGELFGFDRTSAISTQSAEAIARAASTHGQQDDITVLTLQFAPAEVAHA